MNYYEWVIPGTNGAYDAYTASGKGLPVSSAPGSVHRPIVVENADPVCGKLGIQLDEFIPLVTGQTESRHGVLGGVYGIALVGLKADGGAFVHERRPFKRCLCVGAGSFYGFDDLDLTQNMLIEFFQFLGGNP